MINPQNKDEECFKWAATGALHHKVIKHYLERIILLKSYEKQYNWKGLKFPESIMKIDGKEQPWHSSNVLFSNKKNQNLYTAPR